ncbi:MAG: aldo/keto reductase [Candidatus Limnocylindrales bacterium]|jgi:aryl-alcohol dehydrogenase-like predicted oxidoreductase
MDYRNLGLSGLRVSPICLGTYMFGGRTDETEAARIVASARDAGVNFIDTADAYAGGRGEEFIGRLVVADRAWWVIATKAGFLTGPGPNESGNSRSHLRASVETSLRRLATDHLDVFYIHRDDEVTPLEETLLTVGDLIRAGKILYFGFSNFRGWRIAEAVGLCRELGVPKPVVVEPYYNALNRQPEVELLPACDHLGLGVVPYSPLARGLLTGKYRAGEAPPPDSRAASGGEPQQRMLDTEWREESLHLVDEFRARAEAKGMTTGQFALNWLLSNRVITAVCTGPRTLEQWEENLGALDHGFDADDVEFVDRLVPPGYASRYGYHDPKYPLPARVPRVPTVQRAD